jgi:hypothetical protein
MTSTIAIATLMLRALLGPMFQMFPFPGPGMYQTAADSAAPAYVGSASHSVSAYSDSVSYSPTAGYKLFVFGAVTSSTCSSFTVSNTPNAVTWHLIVDYLDTSGVTETAAWWASVATTGATTVSIFCSGTNSNYITNVIEYSGASASPVDLYATSTFVATSTYTTGTTATTSYTNEALVAVLSAVQPDYPWCINFTPESSPISFQQRSPTNPGNVLLETAAVSAKAAYTATATGDRSVTGGGIIITIHP